MASAEQKEVRKHVLVLAAVFAIALGAGATVLTVYRTVFPGLASEEHSTWGQFGDFVGGTLNPIFALFALFALLYTIIVQVRELQAVKAELSETTRTAQLQTFENTFFQMLRLHHQIVDHVKAEGDIQASQLMSGNRLMGREAFPRFCELLDEDLEFKIIESEEAGLNAKDDLESIHNSWVSFFSANYPSLSHYFRNFYNILRYVHDSEHVTDKRRYTRILRAQLSAYELKLLFYNGLSAKNEPFYELAVKYALFEQIRVVPVSGVQFLHIDPNHFHFYDRKAYGDWEPPEPDY